MALFLALGAMAAYMVWGQEVCYRYVTVGAAKELSSQNAGLVSHLQDEAQSRAYCGDTQFSTLLTLEQLAKDGAVTQVGIQWQEPKGWSFSDFEMLDVLESKEIRAAEILSRVHRYASKARLMSLVPWLIAVTTFSITTLLLGFGVAWVRRGFKSGGNA